MATAVEIPVRAVELRRRAVEVAPPRAVSPWIVAISVMLATFMEVLDTAIASVALPYIAGSLAASNSEATWVLTSYLIANAVILPASNWFALRFGRKRFLLSCVVLFTFVLSGYGTWLLANDAFRWTGDGRSNTNGGWTNRQRDLAAFMAGFVFAFAPVRFAHLLGHMQVLSTEWLPFFMLAYVRMDRRGGMARVQDPPLRRAVLPAVFLALNALCDWYFVLYGLLFMGLVVVWRWARSVALFSKTPKRGPQNTEAPSLRLTVWWREAWRPVGEALAVGAVFALLMSPVLVPMLGEAAEAAYLRPPFEETVQLSADLLAFVTPSEFQPWWGEAGRSVAEHFTSSTSERTVFAGYAALALAALGVWRFRQAVTLWLVIAVTFLVLALGPYLHVLGNIVAPLPLPYAWLYAWRLPYTCPC